MKICNKCSFDNSDNSLFCANCGKKLSNEEIVIKKSKKKKIIIGCFIALAIGVLIYIIYNIVLLFNVFDIIGNAADNVSDKINKYKENEENREALYDSIPEELFNRGLISNDLKYVNYKYGWGMEWTDKTDKYYFYIDSNNYDKYKKYWLEGIDKSQYRDDYNSGLATYGDYVFKAINVSDLSYTSDVEYGNVHLTANKTYYLVQIYDEAIYFEYISYNEDTDKYNIWPASNYKEESLSGEYIFYKENDEWVIDKIIR